MTRRNPRRARLAAALRTLREAAMSSGAEFARRTGWVQPKVSRLETGMQLPSEDDLRIWAQHTGASEAELDRIIAARAKRQELLREPGRRWQFVLGEAALLSAPGGPRVQRAQLDHLVVVSDLPDVELGVVPLRAMPVVPLSGFRLLDDEFVFVESLAGEQRLADPDDITPIIQAFEALRDATTSGDQAVAQIQRVTAELPG